MSETEPETPTNQASGEPERPPRRPDGDGYIYDGEDGRLPIGTPGDGQQVAVHYYDGIDKEVRSQTVKVLGVRVEGAGRLVIKGLIPASETLTGQPAAVTVGIPPAVYTVRRGDADMWFGTVDMADLDPADFQTDDSGQIVQSYQHGESVRLGEFRGLTTPEGEEVAA
jgi:hypothetical protein